MNDETDPQEPTPTFEERQRMPAWVGTMVVVLSGSPLLAVAVIVADESGATPGSIAIIAAVGLLTLGLVPLVNRSELRTQVRADGVYFRFRPFHRSWRSVGFDEIDAVRRDERRTFQYGIRWTRRGWEYRPRASAGVEIDRTDGTPIFLGSDRPRELRTAIEAGLRRR